MDDHDSDDRVSLLFPIQKRIRH